MNATCSNDAHDANALALTFFRVPGNTSSPTAVPWKADSDISEILTEKLTSERDEHPLNMDSGMTFIEVVSALVKDVQFSNADIPNEGEPSIRIDGTAEPMNALSPTDEMPMGNVIP